MKANLISKINKSLLIDFKISLFLKLLMMKLKRTMIRTNDKSLFDQKVINFNYETLGHLQLYVLKLNTQSYFNKAMISTKRTLG